MGKPPLRIGFLVDWLMDPYQASVLRGARLAAEDAGVSLLVFPGGVLGAPHVNGAPRNHLFELASGKHLDGFLMLSGTLGNHLGVEGLEEFARRFPGKPLVSIAVEVPGYPAVLVDNAAGMRDAVDHLIRAHGCRRIAFIRGPSVNAEAEARFLAYQQVLEKHGIALDESLLAPGKFQRECGQDAVRLWLDERGLSVRDIDAIVGAADLMVLGALDELTRRKVRIPDDMALVGFDDVEEARFSTPPLSTVRQPLLEQGREALRLVLDQIGSKVGAERVELSTRFLGRRSCGCFQRDMQQSSVPAGPRLSLEASLVSRRAVLRAELVRASRGSFSAAGAGWEDRLLNALADELRSGSGVFVDSYYRVVQAVLGSAGDLNVCQDVIGALRRQLLGLCGDDAGSLRRVETLLHELRVVTSEVLERYQAHQRIRADAWARTLSQVSALLVTSFEMPRLERCLREQLPKLGIKSCFVARYVDAEGAELMAGFTEPGGEGIPPRPFLSRELVPRGLLDEGRPWQLVVMPLVFNEQPFGFVVFDGGQDEGHAYEALAEIIGAALRGAGLTAIIARARESGHPMA